MTKAAAAPNTTLGMNSFFAGIGGFDIAFERAGFSVQFQCEKNKFCSSVLQRHWPETPFHADITTVAPEEVPAATVWTAGFPCQDLSLARTPHGRQGLRGAQSGLFFKLLELMATRRPQVVLIENVAGLLNSHKGEDFKTLVSELIQLGYGVAWRVLNARYFGAPQSRPRVFVCAWMNSPEKAARALFEDEKSRQPTSERTGFITPCSPTKSGAIVPQISFCISATSGRHTGLDWARTYVTYPRAVRRLTPLECERLQGLPDDWTVPQNDFKVPARGIDTERYHAAGNAVCVPVAEWVAKRIAGALQDESKVAGIKRNIEQRLKSVASEFSDERARTFSITDDLLPPKWATGGVAFKGLLVDAPVSSAPLNPVPSKFSAIVQEGPVDSRYYISPNAAQGIVRRVDKLGRTLFGPLDAAIRHLAYSVAGPRSGANSTERQAA